MASLSGFLRNPIGYARELGTAANLVLRPPPAAVPSRGRPRPRTLVFRDLLRWKARYQAPGHDFFRFGLHLVDSAEHSNVLPEYFAMGLRDKANGRVGVGDSFDYPALVEDKEVFLRLASGMGHPVPKLLATLTPDEVCWMGPGPRRVRWEEIALDSLDQLEGFCKPAVGGQGKGVFSLSINDGKLTCSGNTLSVDGLRGRIDRRYLLEERIRQHPKLSCIHPASINTLRVVTVRKPNSFEPLAALLRMGVGGADVDNVCRGGIAATIDIASGKALDQAFRWKNGAQFSHHPDSGVEIEGFEIPFFGEALELVCLMHRDWPFFHSLGWDIAFTPEGPLVIEANDQWGMDLLIGHDRGFGKRFLKSLPEGLWGEA